jgi:hypothetical protein
MPGDFPHFSRCKMSCTSILVMGAFATRIQMHDTLASTRHRLVNEAYWLLTRMVMPFPFTAPSTAMLMESRVVWEKQVEQSAIYRPLRMSLKK